MILQQITHHKILRRGTSKLSELVPNPFDDTNKICSKQKTKQTRFSNTCIHNKMWHTHSQDFRKEPNFTSYIQKQEWRLDACSERLNHT